MRANSDVVEAEIARGNLLLHQGQFLEAVRAFQAALALRPGDAQVLALMGLSYFRGGMFAEARPVYEELVAMFPDDAGHRLNLGLVYLKTGDAPRAIKDLEHSRTIDPGPGRASNYLGLAYARAGRFRDAYRTFLFAGQNDLAREVAVNLRPDEIASEDAAQAAAQAAAPVTELPPTADEGGAMARRIPPGASGAFVAIAQNEARSISQAVAQLSPVLTAGVRRLSASPPMPLGEFATTRLIRPDEADDPFSITDAGILIVRVDGRIFTRTTGVDITGGQLGYEPALRRSRGAPTTEPWGNGRPLFLVSGQGYLVAAPAGATFAAVSLDDDILYVREDLVFGFEESVRWENGHVPGSARQLLMVQFRGRGAVALRTARPLLAVKVGAPRAMYVDARAIAGWIGRVVPRAVATEGDPPTLFVELGGEGVVLVEESTSGRDSRP